MMDTSKAPPAGQVWVGRIKQGSLPSGDYIAIGDGPYEDAILYLSDEYEGKRYLLSQDGLNDKVRVRDTHGWDDVTRSGPDLRTRESVRAEYGEVMADG